MPDRGRCLGFAASHWLLAVYTVVGPAPGARHPDCSLGPAVESVSVEDACSVKEQILKGLWIIIVTLAFLLIPAALSSAAVVLTR